jgi:hypothetical protein
MIYEDFFKMSEAYKTKEFLYGDDFNFHKVNQNLKNI